MDPGGPIKGHTHMSTQLSPLIHRLIPGKCPVMRVSFSQWRATRAREGPAGTHSSQVRELVVSLPGLRFGWCGRPAHGLQAAQ